MKIKNEVMLITYADSLGENLHELSNVLSKHLEKAIGGVHLLPFFPSSGDRGFSPQDYTIVDSAFGSWEDIEELGNKYYLMFDFMINHISRESVYFKDFKKNHLNSKYKDMFIIKDEFFPKGRPTQEEVDLIYKRKDKAPFQEVVFDNGLKEEVWNTFGEDQIDLDVSTELTKEFIKSTIKDMASHGCSLVRLDAFAYAIKKLGTTDFFVEPEIWDLLKFVEVEAEKYGIELLPEIHEHFSIQHKISTHDYFVYDFALPMITLYSLYSGKSNRLAAWLEKSPMKQFTTLDTHDGIGVVDAKDLLSDEELEYTSEKLYEVGANVKKIYSSANYNNLDIYQINSTYFSALGDDDQSYLLARAIQCFAPGIPQVYYVGLLAGRNDIELLEKTKEGRNINRHYYDLAEIDKEIERPVVKKLLNLLSFRNQEDAFSLDGKIEIETPTDSTIIIKRINLDTNSEVILSADLVSKEFEITKNNKLVNL
ncbi:sucrose phosphorylase [Vagococcus fluvialis]|uniref:sucrose phosphorylase n=1 Tax=Vagococcus fluvialis TaxID=2738 RepID=UPI002890AD4C|nr:sucrose phosphorylase [Vagococcus fluvialis]MDT2781602.1 sucrose phosphorylase [Vagococcus fluvialis]